MSQQEFSSLIPFDLPREQTSIIKVIGVGGGGSNAVNHMYKQGIKGVEFLVCNTDAQALEMSPVPLKIQLGPSLTEGRGAGAIPEVGKQAAIENHDELRALMTSNTKMVFVTAGMGGGTGTGAAPIIAGIAREQGVLTVGIVTVPFSFEGRKRKQQAELGIEEMKKNVDALLIICNDKLREIYGNLNLTKAFGHADDVLAVAAKSIAEIITNTMHMNVDFADIQTVMKESGVAIMGSAAAEGDNRAVRSAELALDSPLLNDNHIEGARYILLNITSGNTEVTMDEVGEINDYIQAQAGQTAEIIMGIGHDSTLGDKVGVTIIATGFKTNNQLSVEQTKPEKVVYTLSDDKKIATVQSDFTPIAPVAESVSNISVVENSMEPTLIIRSEESTEQIDFFSENQENLEPVLIIREETSVVILDFPLDLDPPVEAPVTFEKETLSPEYNEPVIRHSLTNDTIQQQEESTLTPEEEMYRRSRERILRLKELSYKMSSPNGIADLEKEPAYKRRNVRLENTPSSGDSTVSRFSLSNDEITGKPEIRSNNSFLHDRVD